MFRIGEFSHLVRVSPRMLRHYEKCGLFGPVRIDEESGYRLYSAAQIPQMAKITRLRDLGFVIEEMREILPQLEDPQYLQKVLQAKMETVSSVIRNEQDKLARLQQWSLAVRKEYKIMVYDVELKKLPPVKVISLRGTIPHYNQEGLLWERLSRYVGERQIPCEGGGYSTYFDEEYQEENPEVEIAMPVPALGNDDGEFIYREYPEIPLAAAVRFSGPFDGGYDAASEKLAAWMETNGYEFAGYLRGQVLVDPDEVSSADDLLTELQAPVRKIK